MTVPCHPMMPLNRSPRQMVLRGVRVHNLKNLDLDIPLDCLVAISGVSGSGKSSLAFETLFREGQRRFIESFSVSARRRLERIEPPDADRVTQIPVAIAVRADRYGPRSTVATVAGLLDGLRLLFARLGKIVCPDCGRHIRSTTVLDIVRTIEELPAGTRCQLAFSAGPLNTDHPTTDWLIRGFTRAIWNGSTHDLNSKPDWPSSVDVLVIADRFVAGSTASDRIRESAEVAFREGEGRCSLLIDASAVSQGETSTSASPSPSGEDVKRRKKVAPSLAAAVVKRKQPVMTIDGRVWSPHSFSRRLECLDCRRDFLSPEPRLFSHFSAGACPVCRGTGRKGSSAEDVCPACHGTRLRHESLVVQIGQLNFAQVVQQTSPAVSDFVIQLATTLSRDEAELTQHVRADLLRRLEAVGRLGLNYLTLDRSASTLSGGETCRLSLSAVIGSRITGTLVVVDEPTAGLSPSEIPQVIEALRQVKAARNSVVVVDHDPSVIRAADYLIELGPGAGPSGGSIVFQGPPQGQVDLARAALPSSDEIPLLQANSSVARKSKSSSDDENLAQLVLTKINAREATDEQVTFVLRRLNVVAGPSGSGKSTLLNRVLFPIACRKIGSAGEVAVPTRYELSGGNDLVEVVLVDQSPLARSHRSNPATWLEVFGEIRRTFTMTTDARMKGFTARDFSFNSSNGGRCRSCAGTGLLKHDMQFLPDVTLTCPECKGSRYRKDILEVKYRGRSIADVLAMSISEAAGFFRSQPRLQSKFRIIEQLGLDYLVLGQPSDTLSGGEAQRLKLAAQLAGRNRGPTLMICDEPTTGLHPRDVGKLLNCFEELVANGHTVVVADNNPEVIAAAHVVVNLDKR